MANSKKRRKIIIFSTIGVALLALALVAIFKKKDPVVTVQTEKVTRRNITETVVANGRVQPVVQVHISPEVSGEIVELPVKEGQHVKKGDLLVKIKPDFYIAALNQAKANYESSLAAKAEAEANLEKAEAEYKRNKELFDNKLISESDFVGFKAAYDVAKAQLESALHQVEVAKATVASAQDSLDKTTIVSPLDGTVSQLNSQLGERVLGTVQNVGTDIMIVADLNDMEARVDIGETDVGSIACGQTARLEVDAFKDRKFAGTVTDIASSAKGLNSASAAQSSSTSQQATQFEVKIRIKEKEFFRPGMSVTAEIETRYCTNVLAVPYASVTTRLPKENEAKTGAKIATDPKTNSLTAGTNSSAAGGTNVAGADKKAKEPPKPIEVVFVVEGDHVKMVPVKTGISDDSYFEITDGLREGQEIVSGGFQAIKDLEDGKKIVKGKVNPGAEKKES